MKVCRRRSLHLPLMASIGSRHDACVMQLAHLLTLGLEERALVGVRNPIRLGQSSEPEPDLAVDEILLL
jgi:hypothetical protein